EDLTPRDQDRPPSEREQRLFRLDDAVIAGRIPTRSVVSLVGQLGSLDGGGRRLCDSANFAVVKESICSAADLASEVSMDNEPGATCDAISIGYRFTAEPAVAGATSKIQPIVT